MPLDRQSRIWILSSNRWNSAITEYALSAARALRLISEYVVFSPLRKSPAEERARVYGLDTRPLDSFGLAGFLSARRLGVDINPDVVVTCGGQETTLSTLLFKQVTLVRFRGQDINRSLFQTLRHQFSHRRISLIVTPSRTLAEKIKRIESRIPVESIILGCDTAVFRPVPRDTLKKSERPIILVLGRLDPIKGHRHAIRLFRLLLESWPSGAARPILKFIGQPQNLTIENIRDFAAEEGLRWPDDVLLVADRIPDIADELSRAAIGLIPSLGSEIICRVAEEFLCCGTPIVVSGVGSLDETLAFDGAGATYRNLDDHAAVDAIKHWTLIGSSDSTAQRDLRAARANEFFSLETMARQLNAAITLRKQRTPR